MKYNRYNHYNRYKNYKPAEGGYKTLPFFKQAEIVYDFTVANAMVCLINQTNELLDQKLRCLEERFVKEGGFRENLLKKRLEFRKT